MDVPCGTFGGRPLHGVFSSSSYHSNGSMRSVWDTEDIRVTSFPNGSIEYADTRGCVFRQLFQEQPSLSPLYPFDSERNFNAVPFVSLAERYMSVPFIICALYLLACYAGMRCMAERKEFKLRTPLITWNLTLTTFSALGFIRTAPHLLYFAGSRGFYASVCAPAEPSYGQGAAGLWTMLFIFSKIPELVDTLFIVLKKKPLIFLHWYHHVAVLLYCWHSYATRSSAGLYFVAMNYGVHAIMYLYYALAAMHIRVKWGALVTALQISQMFVGVAICVAVYIYNRQGRACDITSENYMAGMVMYASYALLFVIFAVDKYCLPAGKGGKDKDA